MKKKEEEKEISNTNEEKAYVFRNFVKEIRRITWPVKKKNYRYFFLTFIFILILIVLFALISLGTTEILKLMGAN